MALSNTTIQNAYLGNGSQLAFPLTFTFLDNSQVVGSIYDSATGVTTGLTQGVEYTVTGGNPGNSGLMVSAPSATQTVTFKRATPLTQTASYIETGAFPAKTHETALDRLTMIAQEVSAIAIASYVLSTNVSAIVSALTNPSIANLVELPSQTVPNAGTITAAFVYQTAIKKIRGPAGGGTAGIENGTVRWQQITLVGADDTDTITLSNGSNLKISGTSILTKDQKLILAWDADNVYWTEVGRVS